MTLINKPQFKLLNIRKQNNVDKTNIPFKVLSKGIDASLMQSKNSELNIFVLAFGH